jgi:hypothetical protein
MSIPVLGSPCGKKRFWDRTEAEAFTSVLAAKNRATGRGKPGKKLAVYQCAECGGCWHAGHRCAASES